MQVEAVVRVDSIQTRDWIEAGIKHHKDLFKYLYDSTYLVLVGYVTDEDYQQSPLPLTCCTFEVAIARHIAPLVDGTVFVKFNEITGLLRVDYYDDGKKYEYQGTLNTRDIETLDRRIAHRWNFPIGLLLKHV